MRKLLFIFVITSMATVKAQLGLTPPSPIMTCETSIPGDGFEVFDLTIRESEMIQPIEDYTFTYHPTSGDALSGTNAFSNPENYTNTISFAQIIFVRVRLNGSSTNEITTLDISVIESPVPESIPENLFIDDGDGDGIAIFDLIVNEEVMIGTQNSSDFQFSYFLSETDCTSSLNAIADPSLFQNSENPQTIYVQMQNVNTGCFSCYNFEVESEEALSSEEFETIMIKIIPNPAKDYFEIHSNRENDFSLKIYSINGILIHATDGNISSRTKIPITNVSAGIYFIEITTGENRIVKRLIKN